MIRAIPIALGILITTALPASAQQIDAAGYEALRGIDLRLATIGHRLVTANAPLCSDLQPATGAVVHAIDQYDTGSRAAAKQVFAFAEPVSVEAVVPDAPVAKAGLIANDGVLAVADRPMPTPADPKATSAATRDAALAIIAAQPVGTPMRWRVSRGGAERTLTVTAPAGCRSSFEVMLGPKMEASSDGRVIQIGVRFFERYTDEQVAAVVAHELAHTVLRHRARLEAAGVKWGLLAEFGRNGRLFRRTEEEADLLGAALMRNAGYDPQIAVRFWRDHGGDVDGGLFRSRTHPSSKARADAIAAEVAKMPADRAILYRPPLLDTRDQPLS
ncbi:M48 family metalloprotease [Sphingomonas sp. BT553]|uniref:M48 family metalloprotease n=2 Tax=Sphingomonas mollis TaxID=2795726 RepID=A0ABS0XPT4_9SPHN|nr:M48 family metalloprotease [Sphingomonas sp. BT553]